MKPTLDALLVFPQRVLPQRALSGLVRWLTRLRSPKLAPVVIRAFCRWYAVNLAEAERSDATDYHSFNDFFTRALRSGVRPLPAASAAIASPADGTLSQFGQIANGQLLQAKGRSFSLAALLAGNALLAGKLAGGRYAVVYLAPRDYHRVHAAMDCQITDITFVPGTLYSVNDRTARVIDQLYARNERVILAGECEWGPCALVMVGAMLVSSMAVRGFDLDALSSNAQTATKARVNPGLAYARGEEMGRFNMGSTVVLLLPAGAPNWSGDLATGLPLLMGQALSR